MMTKKTELNKEEANYSVIYKSKLLNKEFDSLEELKTAEDNFKLSEKKKEEAKANAAKLLEIKPDDQNGQQIMNLK